eukprot:4075803-Amphidinium_carterae.1
MWLYWNVLRAGGSSNEPPRTVALRVDCENPRLRQTPKPPNFKKAQKSVKMASLAASIASVSYTHLRAHETEADL